MTNMIKLSAPFSGGSTIIPNSFFDIYMPRANGYYVKVYLFLQRFFQSGHSNLSVTKIADTFDLTEGDVVRALTYWEKEGLLDVSVDKDGNITRISLISSDGLSSAAEAPGDTRRSALQEESADLAQPISGPEPDPEPVRDPSGEETQLFLVIEQYLGHPLGRKDTSKISYFHEGLGFSIELIDYLFSYCASIDKRDMNYIEQVALGWSNAGVTTPDQAQEQVMIHESGSWKIMSELGLGSRQPAPAEMTYIRAWQKEYAFSEEMILEACRRTVMAVHGPSFQYADSILRSWRDLGIHSMEELERHDRERKDALEKERTAQRSRSPRALQTKKARGGNGSNRFHNFTQRSYNYGELEQKLLQKSRTAGSKAAE